MFQFTLAHAPARPRVEEETQTCDLERMTFDTSLASPPALAQGDLTARVVVGASVIWLALQLWFASPLPRALEVWGSNSTQQRSLHLGFAMLLAFLLFRSRGKLMRGVDWGLALAGALAGSYLFSAYDALAARPRQPISLDFLAAVVGLLLLVEVIRRAFGLFAAMLVLALLAPISLLTQHEIAITLNRLWLTTKTVFGPSLGASTSIVFLCIVLGAVADRLGFAEAVPGRLIAWLGRRKDPAAEGPAAPAAFQGHLGKWIMACFAAMQLPGVGASILTHPGLPSGPATAFSFGLLLILAVFVPSISFRLYAVEARRAEVSRWRAIGRLLLWWAFAAACFGTAALLATLTELVFWPLSAGLDPKTGLALRPLLPLAAVGIFVLVLWIKPATPSAAGARAGSALSFWLPWAILAWFHYGEGRSAGHAAFWAALASLLILAIAPTLRSRAARDEDLPQDPPVTVLARLGLAAVDTARVMVYFASLTAVWGIFAYLALLHLV